MYKSRLLELLRAFDTTEWEQLMLFIQSPYFREKPAEELQHLLQHLQGYLSEPDHPQLAKRKVYEQLFPDKPWVKGKLEKLMTQLLRTVQHFIGVHYAKLPAKLEQPLSHFLQERDLKANLDRVVHNWKKKLNAQEEWNTEHLHEKFLLKELLVKTQEKHPPAKVKSALPQALESLDQYYYFTKLKYACQLLAINLLVMPVDFGNSLQSLENLEGMMTLPHLQHPVLRVYHQAYLVLRSAPEKRVEYFHRFKTLLYQYDEELSTPQRKSLHTLIRNYAILQYHQGDEAYLPIIFDIYRDHLQREFLYHQGKLLPFPFSNIVVFALRMDATDWLKEFLVTHRDKITGTEEAALIYAYNLAHYHFHLQDYEQALTLLPDHFKDPYYKIAARRLELKILFETRSVILDAKIEAFKIFIYRFPVRQITSKQKKANNQFIQILRQIIHPKTAVHAGRREKIRAKIKEIGYVAEKYWLARILNY